MRLLAGFSILLLSMATSRAQDQEGKLIDRLLRPNTELKNNAQDKKFLADRTSIHKQANVRTFYAEKKSRSKEFAGARDFSPWEFNARSFHGSKRAANSSSRTEIVNSDRNYSGRKLNDLRSAHLANRIASNRKFSGERPFLGKGKSQKALSQHDTPLSIDEVRELLNKNK